MSGGPPSNAIQLRQALGTFATGVTVVTTVDADNAPRGFTANSFTSVSLDPPLILVCLAKAAATFATFSGSEHFCVNILAEDQQDICALFASPVRDRFDEISWRTGTQGCPIITDVISWFECAVHDVIDAGDHIILLGRVIEHEFSSRSPLIYCSGSYVELGLLQRAMETPVSGVSTRISAVVNCAGSIPMIRDTTSGKLSLPVAARVGSASEPDSLIGRLTDHGINSELPFVCSVYEDARSKTHNVVYRGNARTIDNSQLNGFELIPLHDIPWDDLVDTPLRMLLERYLEESEHDAFGVYVGNTESGEVHAIDSGH